MVCAQDRHGMCVSEREKWEILTTASSFFFSDTEITVATGDGSSMDVRALPEKEGGDRGGREGGREEGRSWGGGEGGEGIQERESLRARASVGLHLLSRESTRT